MSYFTPPLIGAMALAFGMGAGFADEKVPLADVPEAVVKAVKDKFSGAEIRDRVEKETKQAGVFYELELLKDGKKIEVEVSAEGRIREIETDLSAADLPKVVADAVAERFPSGQVRKAKEEIKFRDGRERKTYEVDVVVDGKTLDVKLDPEGKILDIDD